MRTNSQLACLVFLAGIAGCVVGGDEPENGGIGELGATTSNAVALVPASDYWVSSVEGIGDSAKLFANVDDGTAFAAADNNTTYVRAAAGVEWARHAVGFAGAPSGRVTRVDVNYRAGNGGATGSTVKIYLIADNVVVASAAERPLGSYANFTESFTGLDIADANAMRVRVEFHNTSGANSPRYTMLWASATIETAPVLKPAVRGVMTRDGLPASGWTFINSAVVHVDWSDLQPTQTGGFNWAVIDDELAKLAARGVDGVRIRIYAGANSPSWVKKLYGPAVSTFAGETPSRDCSTEGGIAVTNPQTPTTGCVPYFWRPLVLDAYQTMMNAVGARYDNNDMVREVVDSACMTIYAEPFYRAHGETNSNKRLYNAGLTPTADRACHERAIQIHMAAFTRTRTALAINTWDLLDPTQADYQRGSWLDGYDFVTWARDQMGQRLELQNNGLGETTSERCNITPVDPTDSYWCYLKAVQGPKGFQTETWERLGGATGLYKAIDNGLSMGANSIELPGGYTGTSMSTLQSYDAKLEATP